MTGQTRWLLVGGGVLLLLVLIATAAVYEQRLRTQVITPPIETPSPRPDTAAQPTAEMITGKFLVRLSKEKSQAVRKARKGIVIEASPAAPGTPSPEESPVPPESIASPAPTASPSLSPLGASPSPEVSPELSVAPTASPSPEGSVESAADDRRLALAAAAQAGFNLPEIIDIQPVVPERDGATDEDNINRWFVITVSQAPRHVVIANTETLEPIGAPVEDESVVAPQKPEPLQASDKKPGEEKQATVNQRVRKVKKTRALSAEEKEELKKTAAGMQKVREQRSAEVVEPLFVVKLTKAPNDPYITSTGLWGQPMDDLWNLKRIQAPRAWNETTGNQNLIIAVADSGVDTQHRDLQGNIYMSAGESGTDALGRDKRTNKIDDDRNGYVDDWQGWDMACGDNDPTDTYGHGTHIAGTIAARGSNGMDISGVLWTAKILPVKMVRDCEPTAEKAAAAITYAVQQGARVINMSWGMEQSSEIVNDALVSAAPKAVLVAAAGNDGCDLANSDCGYRFPAISPYVIAVSAISPQDIFATFSNYGAKVELTAPGGGFPLPAYGILSLRSRVVGEGYLDASWASGLLNSSGTSMAAPHVSGVAGLIFSQNPLWTPADVRTRLQNTADDIGIAGRDSDYGYGVVNAARAVGAPPIPARMTSPSEKLYPLIFRTPFGNVALRGSASGSASAAYTVDVSPGYGEQPFRWSTITREPTSVINGLLAQWNTGSSESAPLHDYKTLRLTIQPTVPAERIQIFRAVDLYREPTLSINNDAATTGSANVTLKLWNGAYSQSVRLRNEGGAWSSWRNVVSSMPWTLAPGLGKRAVEAQFQHSSGELSDIVKDSILAGTKQLNAEAGGLTYPSTMTSGVSVAVGDVDGDGKKEFITGSGSGSEPRIKVFTVSGSTFTQKKTILAYPTTMTGGVWVAAGDVDGDGNDEIITGTGSSSSSQIRVFDANGTTIVLKASLSVPASVYRGGVTVAAADLDGDGRAEVVIGAGPGSTPEIKVYDLAGTTLVARTSRAAYDPAFRGGVWVAAGDTNNDGKAEIVTGAGPDGSPGVALFSFNTQEQSLTKLPTTDAYTSTFKGGVRVGVADIDNDGKGEIITAPGAGGGPQVKVFDVNGATLALQSSINAYTNFTGGVFVSGGDLDNDGWAEILTGPGRGGGPHVRTFGY